VILIGKRPGLKSPNSMGIYLTYDPRVGTTDESRNCISNVRAKGLKSAAASDKLHDLVKKAFAGKISGVLLKDEQTAYSLIN
jgi:ethanolamine ammonia-lyase small subunit